MDGKRNKLLVVSLGVLIVLSAVLFLITRDEDRPMVDPAYFAVAETEKIDRVLLVTATDTVDLTFDGTRWKVNGRWEADVQMIKVLMATLRQAAPHRPVAAVMMDTVQHQLSKRGTQVIISEGGVQRARFLAGGNKGKSEAWFLRDGDVQPYVMIIPGYRVYVSGIFELKASGWRNKRIFDFNWRNFKSLAAVYPREPKQGFSIEMRQRYFGIRELAEVDTTRLNDYLDAVSLLMARRFVEPGDISADSILRQNASARLEIRDIADRVFGLELFTPRGNDKEVYGRTLDGQVVVFDRADVGAIVRRRSYFIP